MVFSASMSAAKHAERENSVRPLRSTRQLTAGRGLRLDSIVDGFDCPPRVRNAHTKLATLKNGARDGEFVVSRNLARCVAMPPEFWTDPLMYQGASATLPAAGCIAAGREMEDRPDGYALKKR